MNDEQQLEDIYEDEDDENSENNWRNEYPEEESNDGDDSRGKWVTALDVEGLLGSKTEMRTEDRSILASFPSPLSFCSSIISC